MKNLLVLIAAVSCFYTSVNAQTRACKVIKSKQTRFCKSVQVQKSPSCHNIKFAENFRVCKNEDGYDICSIEAPRNYNVDYLKFTGVLDPSLSTVTDNSPAGLAAIYDTPGRQN
jgi:hypothetical protein